MPNSEFIITLRKASRDINGEVIAHQAGVDVLLTTNPSGRLVFPDHLFKQARQLLDQSNDGED